MNYYNYHKTENTISYQPYLYDTKDSISYLALGIILFIGGIILTSIDVWKQGIYFGILFGGIFLLSGLYRLLVKTKTRIELNKKDDALYKINALGKKKIIALSNIYDVITVSENGCYTYDVTNKKKASAKSIEITSFITSKRQSKPEIAFLENEIMPSVINLLELDAKAVTINQGNQTIMR